MALQRYERIYNGTTVRSPVGSLLYLRAPVTGTIRRVDVWLASNLSIGTAVFNVYQNGTPLWTGGSRPSIASGSLVVSKTELSFAAVSGDILTLDLESIGQAGPLSPIVFVIEIDVPEMVPFKRKGGPATNFPLFGEALGFLDRSGWLVPVPLSGGNCSFKNKAGSSADISLV